MIFAMLRRECVCIGIVINMTNNRKSFPRFDAGVSVAIEAENLGWPDIVAGAFTLMMKLRGKISSPCLEVSAFGFTKIFANGVAV